jgi:hypothetical protein
VSGSEIKEDVLYFVKPQFWVLSLNFRDERSVSGLDVVTVAKDYQGVVSEDLIWARIAGENCHFRLQILYI